MCISMYMLTTLFTMKHNNHWVVRRAMISMTVRADDVGFVGVAFLGIFWAVECTSSKTCRKSMSMSFGYLLFDVFSKLDYRLNIYSWTCHVHGNNRNANWKKIL
jgi:hypothetical protein